MTIHSELVYSTSTDRDAIAAPEMVAEWEREDDDLAYAYQYCYVCGRCTDHVGEHDELVIAGIAEYDGYDVRLTEAGHALRALDAEVEGTWAFAVDTAWTTYATFCDIRSAEAQREAA